MAFFPIPLALALVLASGFIDQADAAGPVPVTRVAIEAVSRDGSLVQSGGGKFCLAGIWIPAKAGDGEAATGWRSAWREVIASQAFYRRDDLVAEPDRYGCDRPRIETEDGVSLQTVLLEAGWAAVDPVSSGADTDVLSAGFTLEDEARRARRGIWKDPVARPKSANALSPWIGTRQLVEGRVQRVHESERYVYLNFGADWRTDFTLRLDRKMIEAAGFDVGGLDGKVLRARGVLQDSRGPLIDISHLQQIELLP